MHSSLVNLTNFIHLRNQFKIIKIKGGIDFEDVRITFPEFGKNKAEGHYPYGSVPVIDLEGKLYGQSAAILRYVFVFLQKIIAKIPPTKINK